MGWSVVQGVLSRGDVRLGVALASMSANSLAAWRRALEDRDLSADFYIHRQLALDEPLPWSAVDPGITCEHLREEFERARQCTSTPPCPPKDCHRCGVC